MNELEVVLSMDAMRSMLEGNKIIFDCLPDNLRVVIVCDDKSMRTFRDQVNKAMLAYLPTPPSIN